MLKALLVRGRRWGCRDRNKNGPESVGGFPAASRGSEAQPCTGLTSGSPRRPWTLGGAVSPLSQIHRHLQRAKAGFPQLAKSNPPPPSLGPHTQGQIQAPPPPPNPDLQVKPYAFLINISQKPSWVKKRQKLQAPLGEGLRTK